MRVEAPGSIVTEHAQPPGQLVVAFGALAEQRGSDKRQTGHAHVGAGSGKAEVVTTPSIVVVAD